MAGQSYSCEAGPKVFYLVSSHIFFFFSFSSLISKGGQERSILYSTSSSQCKMYNLA